jgi:hypothetical protein
MRYGFYNISYNVEEKQENHLTLDLLCTPGRIPNTTSRGAAIRGLLLSHPHLSQREERQQEGGNRGGGGASPAAPVLAREKPTVARARPRIHARAQAPPSVVVDD